MTRPDESTAGDLYFGVDARHVRQLGQQLVGDRVTALIELVKNAYDADATNVLLDFDLADDEATRIRVIDDGNGMSLDDIRDKWMRIAGDQKEKAPISPRFRRTRAGRKGIGRFAAESLGRRLVLRSTQAGSAQAIEITFDWANDYESGTNLDEVANHYRVVAAEEADHGTSLDIAGLHGAWSKAQRERVGRALLLLQPPFPVASVDQVEQDPGFRVEYVVDGSSEAAPSIDAFLEGETAHIEALVDDEGYLELTVTSERLSFERTERFEERYSLVGPLRLSASYFILRSDAIGVPVAAARDLGREFGGVRMYRDGLRLLPYGEQNNDWLGLDAASRRRVFLNPIGNQNFFAQVLIGREANPLLEDTSSREGLLNNDAYAELTDALYEALVRAAGWVAEHRERMGRDNRKERSGRSTRSAVLDTAVVEVEAALVAALTPEAAAAAGAIVRATIGTTTQEAIASDRSEEEQLADLQNELELLRVLASLGTSIAVFSHEVRSVLFSAAKSLVELQKEELAPKQVKLLGSGARAVRSLRDIAGYIDGFTSSARVRTREPRALYQSVERFVVDYATPLARGISVEWEVAPDSLRTGPVGSTAIQAILINLFTNAVKAVDVEGLEDRRIRVAASPSQDKKKVVLSVSDTGSGISTNVRDTLFDAFVTTRSAKESDLGVGTGLGLKVVRDLAEEYGGRAFVANSSPAGYVTTISVELPRWSEQVSDAN